MVPDPTDINEWPPHLIGWVVSTEIDRDGRFLVATVRCPCGAQEVGLHFRGGGNPNPCMIEFAGPDGDTWWDFAVAATCTACLATRTLFDRHLHGWESLDGRVALEDAARPPLRGWACGACGGAPHRGTIRLVRDHILDFLERLPDSVAEDYRNGFTWFAMDIQCSACGHRTTGWADYECR
jgi:hypothetical protein